MVSRKATIWVAGNCKCPDQLRSTWGGAHALPQITNVEKRVCNSLQNHTAFAAYKESLQASGPQTSPPDRRLSLLDTSATDCQAVSIALLPTSFFFVLCFTTGCFASNISLHRKLHDQGIEAPLPLEVRSLAASGTLRFTVLPPQSPLFDATALEDTD